MARLNLALGRFFVAKMAISWSRWSETCPYGCLVGGNGNAPSLGLSPGGGEIGVRRVFVPGGGGIEVLGARCGGFTLTPALSQDGRGGGRTHRGGCRGGMGRFETCPYGFVVGGSGKAPSLCLSPGGGEIGVRRVFVPGGGEIGVLGVGGSALTPALSQDGRGGRRIHRGGRRGVMGCGGLALTPALFQNGRGDKAGNHKGCPYDGLAAGYFQRNRSCRLSPTPPIMKMGASSSVVDFRKATSGDGFPLSRE